MWLKLHQIMLIFSVLSFTFHVTAPMVDNKIESRNVWMSLCTVCFLDLQRVGFLIKLFVGNQANFLLWSNAQYKKTWWWDNVWRATLVINSKWFPRKDNYILIYSNQVPKMVMPDEQLRFCFLNFCCCLLSHHRVSLWAEKPSKINQQDRGQEWEKKNEWWSIELPRISGSTPHVCQ